MKCKSLDEYVDSLPRSGKTPSADLAVYYKHDPVYRHYSGFSDIDQKTPVSPDTLYFIYSASKVATCCAALQLYEQGLFSLEDPLYAYMPEFRDMNVLSVAEDGKEVIKKAVHPIKIINLFTMTAGLGYDVDGKYKKYIEDVSAKTCGRCPTRSVIAAIAEAPLEFEAGTRWRYGLCHDVLAGLVEAVSGQRFSQYMRDHIFIPSGMRKSCYHVTGENEKEMAALYRYHGTAYRKEDPPVNRLIFGPEYDSGGAGIITSTDEYILFLDALGNKGVTGTGERILKEKTVALMQRDFLTGDQRKSYPLSETGFGYGLGGRVLRDKASMKKAVKASGEFGWNGAASAYTMVDSINHISIFYAEHVIAHPDIDRIYSELKKRVYFELLYNKTN